MQDNKSSAISNQPFCVDWADSVYKIKDETGELSEVGTVLAVCNNIIFLNPLTEEQLLELSRVVKAAVDYELTKRKKV